MPRAGGREITGPDDAAGHDVEPPGPHRRARDLAKVHLDFPAVGHEDHREAAIGGPGRLRAIVRIRVPATCGQEPALAIRNEQVPRPRPEQPSDELHRSRARAFESRSPAVATEPQWLVSEEVAGRPREQRTVGVPAHFRDRFPAQSFS
jgi:hypothetical protein